MAEAICLVLDTGCTASQKPEDGRSFLEAALECASLFVERKLFAETKDEIGIVLFGAEVTSNSLDYEHVHVLERGLARPDWETIKYLREHVQGTEVESDWIDAIIVAMDFLKQESEGKKFTALKIVLFSELGCQSNNDQMEVIIRGMKTLENIDFTHIGPGWEEEEEEEGGSQLSNGGAHNGDSGDGQPGTSRNSDNRGEPEKPGKSLSRLKRKPKTKVQLANEDIINQIVSETDGTMCSLEEALAIFLYKNKKGKKPFPWKVVLEIGPDIKISTTGYVKVRRENPKSWKNCLAREEGVEGGEGAEEIKPETTHIRNNEDQEVIEREDLVVSYRYGTEMITITETDEAACKFEGGPKSMSMFGFLSREEISVSDLTGSGCHVFLPSEGDENSSAALSALAQALLELNMVGVVRRVYNKASTPRLGILAPEEDDNGDLVLIFAELPFQEDRRELQFGSLLDEKHMPTDEQVSAVDDLIDAMNLEAESVEEEGESGWQVTPEEMLNPGFQFLFQSLTFRALQPGHALPPVPDTLQHCMDPPSINLESARPALHRIRSLFPLEEVVKKANKTGEAVFGKRTGEEAGEEVAEEEGPVAKRLKTEDVAGGGERTEVLHVGSTTPVEDFRYLLAHSVTTGASLESAGLELEGVVTRLISSAFGTDLNMKIISCLRAYREECRARGRAPLYNLFLPTVKEMAGTRLWADVTAAELGLLAKAEVEGGVTKEEAERFLTTATESKAEEVPEEEDDQDMLDML